MNPGCGREQPCDCCQGPQVLTPLPLYNRPGLSQLRYRVGTYATFFETMQARLSSGDYPQLADLRTREKSDPSIALLDAWSIVGDVLTFYQERIANEGYLRTATERRSVLELARLIGYALRPGVASSVYLAYTLAKDAEPVTIPQGARANSIPGSGEQMQAFETTEPLEARVEWNAIKPRLTQPQTAASIDKNGLYLDGTSTRLKANDSLLVDLGDGAGPRVRYIKEMKEDSENKRTWVKLREETISALIRRYSDVQRFGVSSATATARRVLKLMQEIKGTAASGDAALASHLDNTALPALAAELSQAEAGNFTRITPWLGGLVGDLQAMRARMGSSRISVARAAGGRETNSVLGNLVNRLVLPPSVPPASAKQLSRSVAAAYGARSDIVPRLLTFVQPRLKNVFYAAWKSLPPPRTQQIDVYALRVATAPFGHNAPLRQTGFDNSDTVKRATFGEWLVDDPWNTPPPIIITLHISAAAAVVPDHHQPQVLYLDNDYDIAPDSYVMIEKADGSSIVAQPDNLTHRSLAAYGLSGKTVRLDLPAKAAWLAADSTDFTPVRTAKVHAGSEKLTLADEPIEEGVAGSEIDLDDVYDSLQPGRWLIIAGERADVIPDDDKTVAGVKAAELVMLAAVTQKIREEDGEPVANDTLHTSITLAEPLAYQYKRNTVILYGNVAKATNGETRQETLGGGDAAQAFQQFTLKQPPLTYVSAPTVAGVASTLEVRVNEVEWHEVDSLASAGANGRKFITRTGDEAKTTVVFGNGRQGARLPTGPENVKATYRNGIGKGGNVKAGQISLLNTRPLGVSGVINPIRASGGADKEGQDQARGNAPLAVMALDRLVSTPDYADFSRTFGGIGKAASARLSNGRQQRVYVTIAGADDIPIDPTSDLYRNLLIALHRYGDPYLPITLALRERLALVVSANIHVQPDYAWETLEPKVRSAMLAAFGFGKVEIGQDLLLADAIKTMQEVPGVAYVDVDVFDTISEADILAGFEAPAASKLGLRDRIPLEPGRFEQGQLRPAQLSYLTPEVPDTLILQEIKL